MRNCPVTARSMEELGEACERSPSYFRALSTQATQVLDPNLPIREKIEQIVSRVECKDIRQLSTTPLLTQVIKVKPGTEPIRQKMRKVPMGLKTKVKQSLDDMLACGIIRHSSSPWRQSKSSKKKMEACESLSIIGG
jgi:hypothetical protein